MQAPAVLAFVIPFSPGKLPLSGKNSGLQKNSILIVIPSLFLRP